MENSDFNVAKLERQGATAQDDTVVVDEANTAHLIELGIYVEAIEDKILVKMDAYKSGYECKKCGGSGQVKGPYKDSEWESCPECKGKGGIIIIPNSSKVLPTSGVVISLGENTKAARYARAIAHPTTAKAEDLLLQPRISLGTRVIFSPGVGTLIPFKGNIILKAMREHEPLAIMFGSDAAARDFIDYDVNF